MSLQRYADYLAREYETATMLEIAMALDMAARKLFFAESVKNRTPHERSLRSVPDFELIRLMQKRLGLKAEIAA